MAESDLDPARFGTAFKVFMEAVTNAATPPASPLADRIRAHLGVDPAQLPVIAEEFDSFEHPNLQVALDEYMSEPGRARRSPRRLARANLLTFRDRDA